MARILCGLPPQNLLTRLDPVLRLRLSLPRQKRSFPVASNQQWQDEAACRQIPVELFFPPAEQESEVAKRVCSDCLVREPCLEFALAEGERFGIWGGLTSQERRSVAAKRRKARLAGSGTSEAIASYLA